MYNRKRNERITIWLTKEEKALIYQKMTLAKTTRLGAFVRKMLIDGLVVYTDTKDLKALTKEMNAIGKNINQIARKVNESGLASSSDMEKILRNQEELWHILRRILLSQR